MMPANVWLECPKNPTFPLKTVGLHSHILEITLSNSTSKKVRSTSKNVSLMDNSSDHRLTAVNIG